MSGYLAMTNGTRVPIHNGFVLGRVAGVDLVVDDSKASRRHAKIHVESGVVEIEDLASSNGTLLNDKPVTRRVLRDGDRVQIGKTVIVFHEGEVPGARAGAVRATRSTSSDSTSSDAAGSDAAGSDAADNDLFGDDEAVAETVIAPAVQKAPAARPPMASSPPSVRPAPPVPPPVSPPPPAAPRPSVVEFADEVVEVRKAPPVTVAAKGGSAAAPAVAASPSRVLQFSKRAAGSGGLLGDDMSQMNAGTRGLIVVLVLVLGGAIVWLVQKFV